MEEGTPKWLKGNMALAFDAFYYINVRDDDLTEENDRND